ncbi:MAG: hypothetical protein KC550_02715, partial [Nanoarchaeota archaeon]|nr:hypothetical protein [Nanoarchaeota archaeon]
IFLLIIVLSNHNYIKYGSNIEDCLDCNLNITLSVDLNNVVENKRPFILNSNTVFYLYEYTPEKLIDDYFYNLNAGVVLLDPRDLVINSQNISDLKLKLENDKKLNDIVNKVVSSDGIVELVLANNIPKWLSSQPFNEASIFPGTNREKIWHSSTPKDYDLYSDMIEVIVNHFSNKLDSKNKVIYTFGSEPDNYFVGSEDEFYKMYKYFVKGALSANVNANVGGPMPSNFYSNKFNKANFIGVEDNGLENFNSLKTYNGETIIKNFIEYCAKENLPINHISYHHYPPPSPIPQETAIWVLAENNILNYLDEYGYESENVDIYLDDWINWEQSIYSDTNYHASWIASSLTSIAINTKKTTPVYSGLRDISVFSNKINQKNVGFVGGNGLYTEFGIRKAIFNFYEMLSIMDGDLIKIDSDYTFINGFAIKSEDKIYLLFTNFVPNEDLIIRNSFGLENNIEDLKKIITMISNENLINNTNLTLKKILNEEIDIDKYDIEDKKLKKQLEVYIKFYRDYKSINRSKDIILSTNINVKNLTDGIWNILEYRIDENNANSYALKDKISDEIRISKISKEDLENYVEKVNSKTSINSSRRDLGIIYVNSSNKTEINIELKSNSVVLLEFAKVVY